MKKKALRALAERMGTSQSKILRSAVNRYIKLNHVCRAGVDKEMQVTMPCRKKQNSLRSMYVIFR